MNKIIENIELIEASLLELNQYIYEHPELGNQEFKACKKICHLLENHNFTIESPFIGIPTAFKATYESKKSGPTIVFMAEYDALPDIGHGCGHNMIATCSVGTGIVLSKLIDEIGGKIVVLGTPAEENDGAKVDMVKAGVFETVDVALIAHPASHTAVGINCLAMEAIEFEFIGKAAHAAASPEKGINALDAVISTFNTINALREHVLPTTRIHGVITEGGVVANIVPERAVAQFYVRATEKAYLKELVEKVKNCAKGAALATGASLNIRNYEKSYDNMLSNAPLVKLVENNFIEAGLEEIERENVTLGSADAGNVSHVCPTVHPMFAITKESIAGHTKEFAEATQSDYAIEQMKKVITAFVKTGIDLLSDEALLNRIKLNNKS